jgi:hypothetical protein
VAAIRAKSSLLIERWRVLASLGLVQAAADGSIPKDAPRGTRQEGLVRPEIDRRSRQDPL